MRLSKGSNRRLAAEAAVVRTTSVLPHAHVLFLGFSVTGRGAVLRDGHDVRLQAHRAASRGPDGRP